MTGCMYIQPLDYSVNGKKFGCCLFLADTLATFINNDHVPIITPSNRTYSTAKAISRAKLVRKLYIINQKTIIAFSWGSAKELKRCLSAIDGALPALLHTEDPMGGLAKLVNRYPSVRAVAATLNGVRTGLMSAAEDRFTTRILGECAAIGSGRDTLVLRASDSDPNADAELALPARDRALEFAKNLCSICFAKESGGEVTDWGGCIEYAYNDATGTQWLRGPKTIHLFYVFDPIDETKATVRMWGRFIAYDPGGEEGRILNVALDTDKRILVEDLPLEDLLVPGMDLVRANTEEFWGTWKPDRVSIAVISQRDDGVIASATQDYPGDKVQFKYGTLPMLDEGTFEAFASTVVTRMGFEYVRASTLDTSTG